MSLPNIGRPLAVPFAESRARSLASAALASGVMCLARHSTSAPMPSTMVLMLSALAGKLSGRELSFMGWSFRCGVLCESSHRIGQARPAPFSHHVAALSGGRAQDGFSSLTTALRAAGGVFNSGAVWRCTR